MFFKKPTTSSDMAEEFSLPPSSPTTSLAPSTISAEKVEQAPRSGFFARNFGRQKAGISTTEPGSSSTHVRHSSAPPSMKGVPIGANINEFIRENARLRDEVEQSQEQSQVNKNILHECALQLQAEKSENIELREENTALNAKLASRKSADNSHKQLLREKDEKIASLQKEVHIAKDKAYRAAQEAVGMLDPLADAEEQITELRKSLQRREDKISKLQVENREIKASNDRLQDERDKAAEQALICKKTADSSEAENNVLATQVAVLGGKADQTNRAVKQTQAIFSTLVEAHNQQQLEHSLTVDNLFARQQRDRQAYDTKVHEMSAQIAGLEKRLKTAKTMIASIEAKKGVEIASLREQMQRLQLDFDDQVAQANAWQDYSNQVELKHKARMAAILEERDLNVETAVGLGIMIPLIEE